MRRALIRNLSLYTYTYSSSSSSSSSSLIKSPFVPNPKHIPRPPISRSYSFKFFSSENDSSDQNPKPSSSDPETQILDPTTDIDVEDVSNEELKKRIETYFKGDEAALESVLEAILRRKLKGNHEETDEELMDELELTPVDKVTDQDFDSGLETEYETDDDIPDLVSAPGIVIDRMVEGARHEEGDGKPGGHENRDKGRVLFNPDDKVWAEAVRESAEVAAELGPECGLRTASELKELEEILEDMRDWDKLLPDDIKKKVKAKLDELGDKCERQELEPEEAYQHFKEFEDHIVADHIQKMEKEQESPESAAVREVVDEKKSDDPPGVGPILRWHQRVVFSPGADAWHPKNRKVKLSVKVKELGLSKYQFRRLREIVGKRYHPGKDELTITSERFEHREENRKDCLRTLLNIIEEAGKATALVEEARTSYVKQRLKANATFMARLHAKAKQASAPISE